MRLLSVRPALPFLVRCGERLPGPLPRSQVVGFEDHARLEAPRLGDLRKTARALRSQPGRGRIRGRPRIC